MAACIDKHILAKVYVFTKVGIDGWKQAKIIINLSTRDFTHQLSDFFWSMIMCIYFENNSSRKVALLTHKSNHFIAFKWSSIGNELLKLFNRHHLRLALKNCSILSNGMMFIWSYKSVWLAPGIIINSLLSPFSFLKASRLK